MNNWQPIETAPKDGTKIFIFKKGWDYAPIAKWGSVDVDEGYFYAWTFESEYLSPGCDYGVLGWNEDIEDGNMPTHWSPVPAPELAKEANND